MRFFSHYLLAALIFVVLDGVWIAFIANKFYKLHLGNLLLEKPKFGPAVLFYALYIWGLLYFVIDPALTAHSLGVVMERGLVLGLIMYATYDLTNLSTLKKWRLAVTVVDMFWGTFVTAAVSTLVYVIIR